MTNEQRAGITALREKGYGYTKIGQLMGISKNTVKTFCRRNNLTNVPGDVNTAGDDRQYCRECGKELVQQSGSKRQVFCSSDCRQKWWNAHPEKVDRRASAIYDFTCAFCGASFSAYGNSHRKYCSHSCYVADRFGGVRA